MGLGNENGIMGEDEGEGEGEGGMRRKWGFIAGRMEKRGKMKKK